MRGGRERLVESRRFDLKLGTESLPLGDGQRGLLRIAHDGWTRWPPRAASDKGERSGSVYTPGVMR